MLGRHLSVWLRVGCVLQLLAIVLPGCDSTPPVTETPPPPVSVSQPLVLDVPDEVPYDGRIDAVKTDEVRSRVRGHLEKVCFRDGQIVNPGDLLFEIDPRPYQAALDAAEAKVAAADAALDLATKEYKRTATLARTNAASREEVDVWIGKQGVAKAERLKALADVEQAKLDLGYAKITAPIAGKAGRALVTEGNLVNAGGGETLLTTITTVDPMYVYFDVDERALLRYRTQYRKEKDLKPGEPEPPIKDLEIPIKVGLEGETGFPHEGTIDFADNHVNPATGTIQVRGVLPNADRKLDAGMRARVLVSVGAPRKSLLITERAVGTDQTRRFVYVVNDQKVAERRDVTLGRLWEGLQVVTNGLKPGDEVVVNGIQRVRDGAKVEPRRIAMPDAPAEPTNKKTAS